MRAAYSSQRKAWKADLERARAAKLRVIPKDEMEMRNSSCYCTIPLLRVNEILKKSAVPTGEKLKEDDIYYRKDV